MPIVAGGLLVSVILLLQVFGLISLHKVSLPLVRGLLGGWSEQRGFRRWFLRAIGVEALGHAIEWVVHRVRQAVARAAAANLDQATKYLHAMSVIAHYTYKELGAITPSWADSFGLFRHHTLPHEINRKVTPVKTAAIHAGTIAGEANTRVKAEEKARRRSISLTNQRLGAIAAGLLGIDILVRGRNRARHHTDHARTLPHHSTELARHNARLKRIEKALGLGIFATLIYRTLARVAPWLFCRNWKVLGRAICGLRPDFLLSLLGLLLAVWELSNLRTAARDAERALGFVVHAVWDAADMRDSDGQQLKRPSGQFTID